MVQPVVPKRNLKGAKPSGTLGGGKNGVQASPEKELPGMHVKSAKELREAYVDLQNSPDGMDPDPLTVPKVVECGHCGWPVYPRESKVATKKTFERAGITRGTRKEEEAKKAEMGIVDDDNEDAGSEDSRNTEEKLRDELEDLQDRNEELEKEVSELKEEKEELEKQVKELTATVDEQMDRVEFLEEAEERWQEKLNQAEIEKDELKLLLDRSGMVSADRERGLVQALEEIDRLREELATFKRRRILMLILLEQKLFKKEQEDYLAITFRLWRTKAVDDKLSREAEDLEMARERDVSELKEQMSVEKAHVRALKATELSLKGRLRAAGQRLLARALSNSVQPASKAHLWRVMVGLTPLLATENVLEATRKELEETKIKLAETLERNAFLEADYKRVSDERDKLEAELANTKDELEFLRMEGVGAGAKTRDLEAKRLQKKKELEELKAALEQALADLDRERKKWAKEKAAFQEEIEAMEGRLETAEAAALLGGGNGVPEVDEASRICPKGQGVLCVGCLKQLVHRGVRPLPPVSKLPHNAAERLDKAREAFFEKELRGMPAVDDVVHTYQWKARKDPYGIARLTVWPRQSKTKGSSGSGSRPGSPEGASDKGETVPKTGLPALKKAKKLRAEGVASPLKMSMRDFKPSGFR